MKIIFILLLAAAVATFSGCASYQMEYGEIDKNGHVFYPLCERSKQRITDLRNISFELPELFKQAPCINWPDYSLATGYDRLSISIPSVIERGNLIAIGLGGHSMHFFAGLFYSQKEKKWQYLGRESETAAFSPEIFLEKRTYINPHNIIEHGFIDAWSGGRCGRILSESNSPLDYMQHVEYYCWPHSNENNRQMPFYISAQQSIPKKKEGIPPKSDFTDLDNQLIKPVLNSLVFNPYSDEALQFMADDHARICHEHSDIFFNKPENRIWGDFPDRRSIILSMRDCGHDVPLPKTRIDSYDEIFEKTRNEKLGDEMMIRNRIPKEYQPIEIRYSKGGRISYENIVSRKDKFRYYSPNEAPAEAWIVYKIPREKFARIKQKLLALDVLKEIEPVTRKVGSPTQKPSSWSGGIYYIDIPYDAWYYAPPGYERTYRLHGHSYRAGFGFRYDQELNANVMDINFDDPKTMSQYNFVTLVEGD